MRLGNRGRELRRIAVLAVSLSVLWLRVSSLPSGGNWADLDVYVGGGLAVLRGESLYQMTAGGLPFTYSPFAAILFSVIASLPSGFVRGIFTVMSLLSYAGVVVIVGHKLRLTGWAVGGLALIGLSFEPVFRTVILGQINLLLMFLVVVDVLALNSNRRGYLVGVAAGIKIIPGVFVLVYLMRREWASAARVALGFAATVAVGAIVLPGSSWAYWKGGFADLGRFGPPAVQGPDNQALVAVWSRAFYDPSPGGAITALSVALSVAAGLAAARLLLTDEVAVLVCVAFGGLMASPVSWTHHWVWAVPALMLLVARSKNWWAFTLGAVFLIGPMWLLPETGTETHRLPAAEQAVASAYVLMALVVLTVLAVSRAAPRADAPPVHRDGVDVCDDSAGKISVDPTERADVR